MKHTQPGKFYLFYTEIDEDIEDVFHLNQYFDSIESAIKCAKLDHGYGHYSEEPFIVLNDELEEVYRHER